ncbi:MAG: hypothetical protein U0903_01505 [Planctomycetales bacterium]
MRASGSNPLGMLLLAAPLIAVPAFAIFGIPQFAPGTVTTAAHDEDSEELEDRPAPRKKNARRSADDLFRAERDEFEASLDSPDPNGMARNSGRNRKSRPSFDEETPEEELPEEALKGWKMAPAEDQFADASDELSPPRSGPKSRGKKPRLDEENLASEYDRSESHPLSKEEDSRDYDRATPKKKSSKSTAEIDPAEIDPAFNTDEVTLPDPHSPSRKKKTDSRSRSRDPEELNSEETETEAETRPDSKSKATAGTVREEFTWRKANARLQELGTNVKPYFTMDNDREMYIFHCEISPIDTPNLHQKFEASGYEPMLAVYDVIRQIEDWSADRQENVARHDRTKRQRP